MEVEQGVVKPPLVYIFFLPLFNTQGFNKAHISKAFYRYLIKTGLVVNFLKIIRKFTALHDTAEFLLEEIETTFDVLEVFPTSKDDLT